VSVSVLIVDDHPVVRTGIRGMLEGQPDFVVVGEATNGEEALELVGRLDPDVVLMDLRMPGTDGVAATARLRKQRPETRVLVLTTSDSGADILRAAVEAGAPRPGRRATCSRTGRGRRSTAPSGPRRRASRSWHLTWRPTS